MTSSRLRSGADWPWVPSTVTVIWTGIFSCAMPSIPVIAMLARIVLIMMVPPPGSVPRLNYVGKNCAVSRTDPGATATHVAGIAFISWITRYGASEQPRSGRGGALSDRGGGRHLVDLPAHLDQSANAVARQDPVGEIGELRLQRLIAHRIVDAADGVLDEFLELPPILQNDARADLGFPNRGIDDGADTLAQRSDGRVAHQLVTELFFSGGSFDDRDRSGIVHTELSVEPGLWSFLAGQLQHQRMNPQLDALDLIRSERVLVAKLDAGVDGGMNHYAAGERLVGVQRNLVGFAEFAGDRVITVRSAQHTGPAALRFNRMIGAGEVARRQQRRGQPVLRRASGMKALGHGAEHFAQAHRLRRGKAQRPHHLLFG